MGRRQIRILDPDPFVVKYEFWTLTPLSRDEIESGRAFHFMPPVKIDPRLVPGKDHFRPFRLATAENINGETLHRVHVVFSFTRSALICSGEVGKEMRSQIEEEEVPRSFFAHCSAAVEPLRVVDGGGRGSGRHPRRWRSRRDRKWKRMDRRPKSASIG